MMLTLGLFVFMLRTLPYQSMNRQLSYRWPTGSRVGQRPSAQFLGMDAETITLSGQLLPELTGGRLSLLALQTMAEQGRAWPLIEGTGTIYGMFVIEKITEDNKQFFANGQPREINFSITLKRVDESLYAMFGDLRQQASDLLNKAQKATGISL
ncbi:P2 GpU family protein [Serratia sp. AS12]|uniref:phage tail protein n=1 Tax=Serratia TaxID=613 RepID=UPI00020E9652|nr:MULTISPECIES: phage tail protein [Serratia]AEF43935.1 P2 GpU family protein [Serratia plymuthica AS9]AEF48887.1 P2 GpU family protein [Serratia sp. AS12]AEG26595.1 P2 GpU family protein [Serratia sp. AS13]